MEAVVFQAKNGFGDAIFTQDYSGGYGQTV